MAKKLPQPKKQLKKSDIRKKVIIEPCLNKKYNDARDKTERTEQDQPWLHPDNDALWTGV